MLAVAYHQHDTERPMMNVEIEHPLDEMSMTLTARRPGASQRPAESLDVLQFAVGRFSLGQVLVARSEKGVAAVLLGDDANELREELSLRFPGSALVDAAATLGELVADVVDAIELRTPGPALVLDVRGTVFQRKVWSALREIPVGTRVSYAEVARRIGAPTSARAVATACAANALAVIIPCHRVVTSDGQLSGYRWGVERKRALLEMETAAVNGRE
jgi:AraC family transcriptional regulator of adaptative response/methylated-DNA-[protein]-cysteine methyltransferase